MIIWRNMSLELPSPTSFGCPTPTILCGFTAYQNASSWLFSLCLPDILSTLLCPSLCPAGWSAQTTSLGSQPQWKEREAANLIPFLPWTQFGHIFPSNVTALFQGPCPYGYPPWDLDLAHVPSDLGVSKSLPITITFCSFSPKVLQHPLYRSLDLSTPL